MYAMTKDKRQNAMKESLNKSFALRSEYQQEIPPYKIVVISKGYVERFYG